MWEDIFQVYRRCGDHAELIASDLTLDDAVMFISAWMSRYYKDQASSLELRRQPMDYGKCGERSE